MSNLSPGWNENETEYAMKHWREGKSAAEVARLLNAAFGTNRTRNSVIGKVFRLGESRPEPAKARKPRKTRSGVVRVRMAKVRPVPKVRVLLPPKPLPAPPVILADVSYARPWMERGPRQCAFPIGERYAVMSCCFPTDETYCAAHREAMGGTRKPWSPKDHRNVARAA